MATVLRHFGIGNKEVDQNKLNSYKPEDEMGIFTDSPRKVKHVKTKMALAIAAFVIGLLLIAAAVLYNQGLLQQGINALGGNLSTVANEKAFAVAVAAGALTTTIGLLSIIYLSKKIHETRKHTSFTVKDNDSDNVYLEGEKRITKQDAYNLT